MQEEQDSNSNVKFKNRKPPRKPSRSRAVVEKFIQVENFHIISFFYIFRVYMNKFLFTRQNKNVVNQYKFVMITIKFYNFSTESHKKSTFHD